MPFPVPVSVPSPAIMDRPVMRIMFLPVLFGALGLSICGVASAQERPVSALVAEAATASNERRWAEAAELWEALTVENPTRASYWTRLARARRGAGDFEGAIEALTIESPLGGRSQYDIAFDIARSHGQAGRPQEAFEWLERAFEVGLRHHRTARTDTAFTALRDNADYRALTGMLDSASVSRTEGWRTDVRFLARSLKLIHYDFFDKVDPADFSAYVEALVAEVPDLSDRQILVRLMRLVRFAGDAHTFLFPEYVFRSAREGISATFYKYGDDLFVQSASAAHADLVGLRVIAIENRDPAAVMDSVGQIVSRDNVMWVDLWAADLLSFPQILEGLGLASSPAELELTVRGESGNVRTITLPVEPGARDDTWVDVWPDHLLRGRDQQRRYWFEQVDELDATYFQCNLVFNDPEESLPDFLGRMFAELDERQVDRLIIDLRQNPGGNNFLAQPLLHHLISRPRFHRRGNLYVIIGRTTFSAAMYTAAQLELHVDPVFVGEPTGSKPNFVGETVYIRLPFSGLEPSISNLYWQGSHEADYRSWIGPHLYAPPSIESLRNGLDPALEAIRVDIESRALGGS